MKEKIMRKSRTKRAVDFFAIGCGFIAAAVGGTYLSLHLILYGLRAIGGEL